jgi:putative transcriptional regulator
MRIIIAPMKPWWVFAAFLVAIVAQAQERDAANGLLLVAKPGLVDPNFRETVVLVTQTPDYGTVGVILNRPTPVRHERTGESIYSGGPVMPRTLVALFRSDEPPEAPAFHVLKRVYLSMHPDNIERQLARPAANFRLFAGFSGWAPRQLEAEIGRDGWYVLPANEDLLFRKDTTGMWGELVERARGERARRKNVTYVAIQRLDEAARNSAVVALSILQVYSNP